MSEENTARNKIRNQAKHVKRALAKAAKRGYDPVFGCYDSDLKVPRGTARKLRRVHLQRDVVGV